MTLPVSRLVRVAINLSPLAASTRSFGVLMCAGDSDVINGLERFRSYDTIDGVVSDFGTDAPEYEAAALYFGQSPKPKTMMIGRWLRTATAGENDGGILTSAQALIGAWTSITNGAFKIPIDGDVVTVSGLNFSGAANLNAVAALIDAGLAGGTCIWNGTQFVIQSDTTGAGAYATGTITCDTNPAYGVQASATIELTDQPANGNVVVIQGTTVTFVTGTATGNQVHIGSDVATTSANLQTFLEESANVNLALMTYSTIALVTTMTARLYGTAGNSYTLTKTGANITISGANFAGGVAADTLTVNGTAFTFVPSTLTPTTTTIVVGATAAITAANINTKLNASVISGVAEAGYAVSSNVVTVTYGTIGTDGNAFTLAESSAHISISGAVLTGGVVESSVGYATSPDSGTDISAQLKMTSSTSIVLVPGYDAETPVECAAVLANMSAGWYGLMFAASTEPTADQNIDVCDFIQAQDLKRIFGVTITDTSVLSALVTTDLASRMKLAGYLQCFNQYSENEFAIASYFGRAFSVNFNANRSTINLMYKQEPSVTPVNLTTNQANVLKSKRCNVFTQYVNDTSIIQYGVMSGSAWFDEIHGLDWFQDAVQTACYNLMYTSTTKIPQTDAGVNQFTNAIAAAADQAVANGLVAPGVWNADGFGQLSHGQFLKEGYYIYAQPIALQSQSDRDLRIAPPIQVALKLAGAIQELDVLVNVNR